HWWCHLACWKTSKANRPNRTTNVCFLFFIIISLQFHQLEQFSSEQVSRLLPTTTMPLGNIWPKGKKIDRLGVETEGLFTRYRVIECGLSAQTGKRKNAGEACKIRTEAFAY